MRSSAMRASRATSSGTLTRFTMRPSTQRLENPQQVRRVDAEHRAAQAEAVVEGYDLLARRQLARHAHHHVELGADGPLACPPGSPGSSSGCPSVEPIASAFCATSKRHSGCTITLTPGICARRSSTIAGVKRLWTEQWPFQSRMRADAHLVVARARRAPRSDPRPSSPRAGCPCGSRCCGRGAGPGRTARARLRAKRPLDHGARVRRGADGAAVAADEGLQVRGRVHVGDGHDVVADHARDVVPAVLDLADLGHVGHRAAGVHVGQHDLSGAGPRGCRPTRP